MTKKKINCPICEKEDIEISEQDVDFYRCKCPRCGEYSAIGTVVCYPHGEWESWWNERHIVSAVLREKSILNDKYSIVSPEYLTEFKKDSSIPKTDREKYGRLLYLLSKSYPNRGDKIELDYSQDYPLCYGNRPDELKFFVEYLIEEGYLKQTDFGNKPITITVKGWKHLVLCPSNRQTYI